MTIYREDRALLRERVVEAERELSFVKARVAALDEDVRELLTSEPTPTPKRRAVRLVSFVPIMIVCSLAGAWFVWTRPLFPHHHSRVLEALRGAQAVEQAADIYLSEVAARCPTIEDLVAKHMVDRKRGDDPWGRPYRFSCDEDGAHAFSTGRDGEPWTADDISARLREVEARRLEELYGGR